MHATGICHASVLGHRLHTPNHRRQTSIAGSRLTDPENRSIPFIMRIPRAIHAMVNPHDPSLKPGRPSRELVVKAVPGGVVIAVRVIARAGRSGIAGVRDGALLVRLHAAPVDGAANSELVEVLAAGLAAPKRAVAIVSGERSRRKTIQVSGITVEIARSRLGTSALPSA